MKRHKSWKQSASNVSYGSDHSASLYATIIYKNVAVEEFASLLSVLTVFLSVALFLSFY